MATRSRYRPQKQRPPLAVEGRRAGRGVSAQGAHRSTTAWGPGPASSACGRWWRPLSRGPREARAPRGWKSPGRWPLGRRGHAVRGAALTCVCAAPRSGAFRSGDRPSLQLPFPQDRSWEIRRPSASALANVASHAYALSPVAAHAWELAPAAAHSCALAPGPVGAGRGVSQPQDYWLEYPYFTFP